jgi:hypothetical protein
MKKTKKATHISIHTFRKEICVKWEDDYEIIAGDPQSLEELDAEDGDAIAIYRLDRVSTLQRNPKLV